MDPPVDHLRSPDPVKTAFAAESSALPLADDPPEDDGGVDDEEGSGIDITGATISQDWSGVAAPTISGEQPCRLASPICPTHSPLRRWSPLPDSVGAGRIQRKDAPSILLPYQSQYVSHIALDIGGSLVKLVYFSMGSEPHPTGRGHPGGKLHFVKFETAKVDECIDFIEAKGLHRRNGSGAPMRVKATGGGAFKYAEVGEATALCNHARGQTACMGPSANADGRDESSAPAAFMPSRSCCSFQRL